MSATSTETTGPSWLEMKPAHFDVTKLPRKHRKADPGSLWTVADLMPEPATAPTQEPDEGQGELFPL